MSTKEILALTEAGYKCPAGEEGSYHCRVEVKKFSPETGERLSRPRVAKFGRKWFDNYGLSFLRQQGYDVDILHDPKKDIKEKSKK